MYVRRLALAASILALLTFSAPAAFADDYDPCPGPRLGGVTSLVESVLTGVLGGVQALTVAL